MQAGPTVEEPCPALKDEYDQVYNDEATGVRLCPQLVREAVKEESLFMRELQVYHEASEDYVKTHSLKAIGTRWIYANKGDATRPVVRARLVAQETKRVSSLAADDSNNFAATPLLEGLRFMLSRCMAGPHRAHADVKVLVFYDISRADFHSKARRKVVIRVPKEDNQCTSGYALLNQNMYGTKDAVQCVDLAVENRRVLTVLASPPADWRAGVRPR